MDKILCQYIFIDVVQAADLVDGKSATYTDLAQGQMDYILGGNPKGQR